MTDIATHYETAMRPLTAVVDAVPPYAWDDPSPCEGWSARDVVGHLISTQRETLTEHGVDLGDTPDVTVDPAAAWAGHSRRVLDALADAELVGRAYDGFLGPTTVGATVDQFYVWDMYVHRWDLSRAAGLDASFSDAELDRIERGADSFGGALHMDGMCRPPLAPTGADRATRVLARLGRAG